ncbi:MAG: hypothetical protein AAFQ37_00485 [Bacteroidota bacterium]
MKNEKKICPMALLAILAIGAVSFLQAAGKINADALQYTLLGLCGMLAFAGGYCLWQGRHG